MSKIKFICEYDDSKIEMEMKSDQNYGEFVENFKAFSLAIGFHYRTVMEHLESDQFDEIFKQDKK